MKFFSLFVFALVVLSGLVAGQIDFEPKLIGPASAVVELNWDVSLNGQSPSSLSFSSFAFINYSNQRAVFTSNYPFTMSTDDFGNQLLTFQLDSSKQTQRVTLVSEVNSYPESGLEPIEGDTSRFTQQSNYVVISPAIQQKAAEIAGGESNVLKKTALLSSWVHNNVVYDLAYQNNIINSDEVFQVRRGVCNEFSHLLLAMLRSQNIPARFVAGFVYSGETWAPHAWVEVAVNGQWYPFDPTYNEGIILDGSHFKFASGVDQADVAEHLSARGNIDIAAVSLNRSHSVQFSSVQNFSRLVEIQVSGLNETVNAGSIQTVLVTLKSLATFPAAFPVEVDAPAEVKLLSDRSALFVLSAGEEKTASWRLLIPSNLSEGFVYTYPVVVRSLGAKNETRLTAKFGASDSTTSIQVKEMVLEGNSLKVRIVNGGNSPFNDGMVNVSIDGSSYVTSLSIQPAEQVWASFDASSINRSKQLQALVNVSNSDFSFVQPFILEAATQTPKSVTPFVDKDITYSSFLFPAAILVISMILIILLLRHLSSKQPKRRS